MYNLSEKNAANFDNEYKDIHADKDIDNISKSLTTNFKVDQEKVPFSYYIYRGTWQNDLKHGKGSVEWEDEVQFDGEWENGKIVDGQMWYKGNASTYDG